jgi:arginine N-succinyltransferase
MDPAYRTAPERLGSLISYVRFLYMAGHRELFKDEVVAELLPPLEPDGTSHLWEALGRKFTEMSYAEADVLSKKNKEFIKGLFPDGAVYATLLPKDAQDVIGKVGAQTRGVEKMLRRIGFRYADRVDPFDGGPHFFAAMEDIQPVRDTRSCVVGASLPATALEGSVRALVAVEFEVPPFFRATLAQVKLHGGRIQIDEASEKHLGLEEGRQVLALPLP